MKIIFLKENDDNRYALTPASLQRILECSKEIYIEKCFSKDFEDKDFEEIGAKTFSDKKQMLKDADIIVKISKLENNDIALLKKGAIFIGSFNPFEEKQFIELMQKQNVSSISMNMIPRTTLAQKMDVLSSQSNLAGYSAVILAASKSNKIFPMLTTAAGTISPAVVFIIGSGVAGLQAIATAKRLGAKVFAFDVRKEVKEQIESLGAKFVEINVGDVKASEGYAKELKQEQLERQKQEMIKILKKSDIVITTAQVFGRKAPLVIDKSMIKNMKKGSIIIDLAIETGGNVEGAEIDKEILINDVLIIGPKNLPSNLYKDASQMYSMNVFYFLESFWKNEGFKFDINDKILKNCLITYDGKIVNEKIKQG